MSRFEALVEQHRRRAYRAAQRVLGDRDEALDALQEACLALHQRLDEVGDEAAGAWLACVATRRALDRVRKRRPTPDADAREPDDPHRALTDDEQRAQVARALDALSRRQREVVLLRVYEAFPWTQIAAALGLSEGAAKVHYRRGIDALRNKLHPHTVNPR